MLTYSLEPLDIQFAMNLASEFWQEARPGRSIQENLTKSLQMRTQDLDAKTAVSEILEGVHSFNGLYAQANHQNLPGTLKSILLPVLNAMEPGWRRSVIRTLHENCASFAGLAIPEVFDEETALEEAIDVIARFDLDDIKPYNPWMPKVLGEKTVEKLFSAADDTHCTEYLAAALYLQQLYGHLDTNLSAREMGALTAATLTGAGHAFDGALNNLTKEDLHKLLQVVAAVLAFVLLACILMELTPMAYDAAVKILTPVFSKAGILSKAIPSMLAVAISGGAVVLPGVKTAEKVADLTSFHENVKDLWNSLHTPVYQTVEEEPFRQTDKAKTALSARK